MKLDRTLARALVDAGYMPLAEYLRKFGKRANRRNGKAPARMSDAAR